MKNINIEVPEKGFVVVDCERKMIVDAFHLQNDGDILLKRDGCKFQHRYLHPSEKVINPETLKIMVKEITGLDSA